MGKPRSQTTFRDEQRLERWSSEKLGDYATKLSDGARTVVAHGTTPEESQERASRVWETREKQIADVADREIDEGLAFAFEELAQTWAVETAHLSSPLKLMQHSAYRQIIGLGPAVLPLLLRDLAATRRFWFPALNAITGENPIPDDADGDVVRMTDAWIAWGRERRLI
jgi:hypothetical protein